MLEDEGSGGGMMLMMSGSGDDVWISAMTRQTNGLQLSLDYTESYSGQVWSAYSYDVQYCPITNSTGSGGDPQPPGTNDPPACTNCPSNICEFETTNNFMGLERVWSLAYSNLLLTGATRTVWLDTRPMGLDAQTNPTHRFYGFGSNVDTDNDGLNDGYELFVSKTNPNHWDTDGDGLNDGWEVQHGLNPLSAEGDDGRDGDPDRDGWTNFEEIESGSSPVDRLDVPSYFAPGVMISEFVYLPASGKPQWIELFNANQHFLPIDLGDFRVQRTSNGVFETVYTIPTNTIIHPGDTLLIVGPGSGVTGDLTGTIDLEKPYDGTNSHTAALRLIKPANAPGFFEDTVDACLYDSPDEFSLDPAGFDDYGYEIFAPFTFMSNSLVRKWPAEDRNVGGLELRWTNSPTPHRAGQGVDPDQDGLTTLQEWTGSQNPFNQEPTDPFDADSDDDGLSDLQEMTNSPPTNPLSPDTDGDDFPWGTTRYTQDNQEAGVGTDPHNPDTDGDGLYDGWELALGLDPLDTDSDNDGTPDGDEDYDGDGVSNLAEQSANSNPANASQTTGGPYIVTHQHTKPNWSNGDDFGYNGRLTVTFSNLRSNQNVCVLLEEGGYEDERFNVSWQGAAQWCWIAARTGVTSATVRNGQNNMRLIVTDLSPPPHLQPTNQGADVQYTVLEVESIDATSPVAGTSINPPPFEGHRPWPFNVTNSPNPDKHMVVFYKDAIDSSFNVTNFDATLTANVTPGSISHTKLNEVWSKISGPHSGSFDRTDSFQIKYQNPTQGGVYRFEFTISGCDISEANVVLPLAGAEVDGIVSADIGRADSFATNVMARYSWWERQSIGNGMRWFFNGGAGDYLGRPNNSSWPTVWAYNQIDAGGMGAVATWNGTPIRIAKISNFMVAYGARKIGVNPVFAWISQVLGSFNDSAASKSWDAGWDVAGGASYSATVAALVVDVWDEADEKNRKLWPNSGSCDNFVSPNSISNFDNQFTSPGFLYMTSP
ncbi:MAG TPA: lamin tail domain-containing protein [Verrucomicrobiota bacterium]|nr:lamin tail domain-containing protein [Verrucomicrobiota bacterium]